MHQKCVWWPGCARTHWGACSAPPDPLAELKGREWETGGGRKGRGDGRGSEGEKEKGEDPHCIKCVDAHADLSVILSIIINVLALWRSMHRSARTSEIDKNSK